MYNDFQLLQHSSLPSHCVYFGIASGRALIFLTVRYCIFYTFTTMSFGRSTTAWWRSNAAQYICYVVLGTRKGQRVLHSSVKFFFNVLFSFNNQDRPLVTMIAFRINLNNDSCTLHVGTNY